MRHTLLEMMRHGSDLALHFHRAWPAAISLQHCSTFPFSLDFHLLLIFISLICFAALTFYISLIKNCLLLLVLTFCFVFPPELHFRAFDSCFKFYFNFRAFKDIHCVFFYFRKDCIVSHASALNVKYGFL